MHLNSQSLNDRAAWESAGVALPRGDIAAMTAKTIAAPIWVHFGAGNIFRSFIAGLSQRLLNEGLSEKGVVVAETFDHEIIERVYTPFDNLALNVILNSDASVDCEIIASVAEALRADAQRARLIEIFEAQSLQMVSFTITEKGYSLRRADGNLSEPAKADMAGGPERAKTAMGIFTGLLLARYNAGAWPIAAVSMDNCSHNGEKLKAGGVEIARAWCENGYAARGFLDYLNDEKRVSFPWSMIDKITPRPATAVYEMLEAKGIEGMEPIVTGKGSYVAPFVNAERPQYLVVEDAFPNGRPPLEKAGVYTTDRDTVNKAERMKVTTCLNPLHTAMSVFGCLLGYTLICDEMKDSDITALIRRLGYVEGLPVATDPGILSPKAFIDEVINERLPNPFMPDDPRRIATDTSQKVGIRFGETIKSYIAEGRDLDGLVAVPLAIAAWMRYLIGVGDSGEAIEVSPDPLKKELQQALSGIVWNDRETYNGELNKLLANAAIFGLDLAATPLAARIEEMFVKMLAGPGSVRSVLRQYLLK